MMNWTFDAPLFMKVERAFRSFFSVANPQQHQQHQHQPPTSTNAFIRDLSIPIAVNTSCSIGHRFWLDKIAGLVRDRCRKYALELLNEIEMMAGSTEAADAAAAAESAAEKLTYILNTTAQFHRRFSRATKFLSAACYHLEQTAVEEARSQYIHHDRSAVVNITEKAQRKAMEAATLEHVFTEAFVAEYLFRAEKSFQDQQQHHHRHGARSSSSSSSSEDFFSKAAAVIVDMAFSHSTATRSTALYCARIFSSVSGFRASALLPALRQRVAVESAATAAGFDTTKRGGTAMKRARAVFALMERVRTVTAELLPATRGVLEFKPPAPSDFQRTGTSSSSSSSKATLLKFARRDYSQDHTAEHLVQHARTAALGGEVRMSETVQEMLYETAEDASGDVDGEGNLTRAILSAAAAGGGGADQGGHSDAFALFSVAGVEETAKALAIQSEDFILESLSQLLTVGFRERGLDGHGAAICDQICLPFMRFVTCDECLAESPFQPLPGCESGHCCAGHTIVASALRGAIHSAFSFPKFAAFVTSNLLLHFHDGNLRCSTTVNSNTNSSSSARGGDSFSSPHHQHQTIRLLQLISCLSTSNSASSQQQQQQQIQRPSSCAAQSSSGKDPTDAALAHAMMLLGQSSTDWTWCFHQLAFDRMLRLLLASSAHEEEEQEADHERINAAISYEMGCAEMMRHVVASDAVPYVRKYRGLIKACEASLRIRSQMKKKESNSIRSNSSSGSSSSAPFVIPFHFAAFLSSDAIPVMSASKSGVEWPPGSADADMQRNLWRFVESTTPSTRLYWMPDDGLCTAEVRIRDDFNDRDVFVRVCGSPVQIAALVYVGKGRKRTQLQRGSIDGELYEHVWGCPPSKDSNSSRHGVALRCALAALASAHVVSRFEVTCSGAIDLNDSFLLQHAAEHRDAASVPAIDVRHESAFSRSRVDNLRSVYTTAVQTALSKPWGPITAAERREAKEEEEKQRKENAATLVHRRKSSGGSAEDSAGGGSSGDTTPRGGGPAEGGAAAVARRSAIGRISTVAAKALAIGVLKREGKLPLGEWLRKTRELLAKSTVTLELPSRQFRDAVVPELVQQEFVELEEADEGKQLAVYLP